MVPTGAGESGNLRTFDAPEAVMPDNEHLLPMEHGWLVEQESRFDEQLVRMLSSGLRDELSLLIRGISTGGEPVDLDASELTHDLELWRSLTPAQHAELLLITRGESTKGPIQDLKRLEESIDRRVG